MGIVTNSVIVKETNHVDFCCYKSEKMGKITHGYGMVHDSSDSSTIFKTAENQTVVLNGAGDWLCRFPPLTIHGKGIEVLRISEFQSNAHVRSVFLS